MYFKVPEHCNRAKYGSSLKKISCISKVLDYNIVGDSLLSIVSICC